MCTAPVDRGQAPVEHITPAPVDPGIRPPVEHMTPVPVDRGQAPVDMTTTSLIP